MREMDILIGSRATHLMAADLKSNESKYPSTAVKPGFIVSAVSLKPRFATVTNFGVGYIGFVFSECRLSF